MLFAYTKRGEPLHIVKKETDQHVLFFCGLVSSFCHTEVKANKLICQKCLEEQAKSKKGA